MRLGWCRYRGCRPTRRQRQALGGNGELADVGSLLLVAGHEFFPVAHTLPGSEA